MGCITGNLGLRISTCWMWKKRLSCAAIELMATVPQGPFINSREVLGKLKL